MSGLLESLSMDPALVDDFNVDPALFLRTVGLDPVESWAVLTRNGAWMSACVRYGSGCGAAVAWGLATTEEEARLRGRLRWSAHAAASSPRSRT